MLTSNFSGLHFNIGGYRISFQIYGALFCLLFKWLLEDTLCTGYDQMPQAFQIYHSFSSFTLHVAKPRVSDLIHCGRIIISEKYSNFDEVLGWSSICKYFLNVSEMRRRQARQSKLQLNNSTAFINREWSIWIQNHNISSDAKLVKISNIF